MLRGLHSGAVDLFRHSLLGVFFLPKRPRWLIAHDRYEEALEVMVSLKPTLYNIPRELILK
jgi:hypothetical protein